MKKISCFIIMLLMFTATSCSSKDNYGDYAVKFLNHNDSIYSMSYVNDGDVVTKPEDPYHPGYEFKGWLIDEITGSQLFDFSTKITSDTYLYAEFSIAGDVVGNVFIDDVRYMCYDDGQARVHAYYGDDTSVDIESVVTFEGDNYDVVSIDDYAFSYNDTIKEVKIPDSITHIGKNVFSRCSSLESIKLPSNIQSIGESTFEYCISLKTISIPSNTKSIGFFAFSYCIALEDLYIPDSVEYIDDFAFLYCESLVYLELPKSVSFIGFRTFSNCISLEELILSDSLKMIDDLAFLECTSITNVEITKKVFHVGYGVFQGCTSLLEINVDSRNKYFTSIDGNFYSKDETSFISYAIGKKETTFVIPQSVTIIKERAFYECEHLTSISMDDNVEVIERFAFSYMTNLETVKLSNNLKILTELLFDNCKSLTSIIIPSSVEEIETRAFNWCISLESIIIPSAVTNIGKYVFSSCDYLTIYCEVESRPDTWSYDWNASNCPVIWGC